MKQVKEMPKTGQFVAVWEYGGTIWSSMYKYINDSIHQYHDEYGDFMHPDDLGLLDPIDFLLRVGAIFFITE